jgi:hypothetical protein
LTREEIREQIESSRPAGYFDSARGLLEAYAGLMVELNRLQREMRPMRPGTPEFSRLLEAIAIRIGLAAELAEALHLCPGDHGKPPPRLQ